ncbi:metallophosphoesterase, partial [Avrilella dinanensis]
LPLQINWRNITTILIKSTNYFSVHYHFLENRSICLAGINFLSVPARMALHYYPKIKLPEKTDFLLTHAPPKDILDNGFGCTILKKFVNKLKPSYHLFGHIHETAGQTISESKTIFMNTSFINN